MHKEGSPCRVAIPPFRGFSCERFPLAISLAAPLRHAVSGTCLSKYCAAALSRNTHAGGLGNGHDRDCIAPGNQPRVPPGLC